MDFYDVDVRAFLPTKAPVGAGLSEVWFPLLRVPLVHAVCCRMRSYIGQFTGEVSAQIVSKIRKMECCKRIKTWKPRSLPHVAAS